jgi:hypothetical protein
MGETYAYYKLDNINEVINNGIWNDFRRSI